MLNKRTVLGALIAGGAINILPGFAAASEDQLSPSAMQSDLALLKRVYTNLHPGLYRYSTPAQIDARFEAVSNAVNQPMPLAQFYLKLASLLSSIQCGHSYANFYSQPEAIKTALFSGRNRLPFRFIWANNIIVVTDPAGVVGLVRGSRITRINNVATRDILGALVGYVRADGSNIGKQTSLLSVNRDEGYQTFDIFYALHYGAATTFDLQGTAPTGATFNLQVSAIDLAQRRAMTAPPALAPSDPRWQLAIKPNTTAVLTMPTWGLYSSAWDWKAWLAMAMAQIQSGRIQKLIIDLRGNEGGRDDCGPEILGYLTNTALPPQAGQRRMRYRKIPDDLNAVLDTWDDRFRDWGDKAVLGPDGMYQLTDETGRSGGGVVPKSPQFTGKVVALTDAANSSATLQFCQMFRANRLGKVIGETTGGNLRGINAEKFMFCRLPGTGIKVDVPLVGFFPDGAPINGGLVPDVVLPRRWQDVARGIDHVMDHAMRTSL